MGQSQAFFPQSVPAGDEVSVSTYFFTTEEPFVSVDFFSVTLPNVSSVVIFGRDEPSVCTSMDMPRDLISAIDARSQLRYRPFNL